jgi:hypothetical protein
MGGTSRTHGGDEKKHSKTFWARSRNSSAVSNLVCYVTASAFMWYRY